MKTYYSKFFNLEMNPFGETPDPDFYYGSAQHNRALRDLDSALRQGKGFSLLTGEVGTGKTLCARLLLTLIAPSANTALILYPKFNEIELLQAICEEFEIPQSATPLISAKNYVDHLNAFLLKSMIAGKRSVLVIDEAQSLSIEALETIRLLTNLETKTQKLLQIVLVGQPELIATLDRPEIRQLKQRVGVHTTLRGLDVVETEKYIKSRIEQVVNGNFIKFDVSAVKVIHELSNGVPRRINHLCEQIIIAAQVKRTRLIESKFVCEALGIKPKGIFSFLQKGR